MGEVLRAALTAAAILVVPALVLLWVLMLFLPLSLAVLVGLALMSLPAWRLTSRTRP